MIETIAKGAIGILIGGILGIFSSMIYVFERNFRKKDSAYNIMLEQKNTIEELEKIGDENPYSSEFFEIPKKLIKMSTEALKYKSKYYFLHLVTLKTVMYLHDKYFGEFPRADPNDTKIHIKLLLFLNNILNSFQNIDPSLLYISFRNLSLLTYDDENFQFSDIPEQKYDFCNKISKLTKNNENAGAYFLGEFCKRNIIINNNEDVLELDEDIAFLCEYFCWIDELMSSRARIFGKKEKKYAKELKQYINHISEYVLIKDYNKLYKEIEKLSCFISN